MDEVIDKIIDGIVNVRESDIKDSEKLEHIRGILKFSETLLADIVVNDKEIIDAKK